MLNKSHLFQLVSQVSGITKNTGAFLLDAQKKFTTEMIEKKGVNNLVSSVDKEAEQYIVRELGELLPEAGFIAEEGTGLPRENGLNWIIDPLDGTTNFVHNIPFFCISIALIHQNELLLGVIYDPSHNELFTAIAGEPAHLNNKEIKVSDTAGLDSMLWVTGFPYDSARSLESNLKVIGELTAQSRGIRRMGSAALDMCYVACGRFDGFYEVGLQPWDVAAGTLIVKQAGGMADDFEKKGNPVFEREIIASSPEAFDAVWPLIRKHFKS